jgi:D-arabinose 1-dehydrogenase-like Zn-dependent alcohol dehydrogenase
MDAMFSVCVTEPGKVELVEIPDPEPGPYEAVIKTELAFLCNATDRKLTEGHFHGVKDYPLLLGHESVGIVDSIGESVATFKPGDRVVGGLLLEPTRSGYYSGWGGFSEFILVKDHPAMIKDGVADKEHGWDELFQIQKVVPKGIPVEAAGLLCTWREVYAGFRDFRIGSGEEIVIFGAGPVGLSFVRFARLFGMKFIGSVDPNQAKKEKAIALGADEVYSPDDKGLCQLAERCIRPLDAVVDAVGRESIINCALPLIKMAGSVCVYGVIDRPNIKLAKDSAPYNFNLLVHQWPTREYEAAAQEPICGWIRDGKLRFQDFITAEYEISQIQDAIDCVKYNKALKVALRF